MIAIDCDGVIINTIRMFIQLNNELNNRNDNWKDVTQWDFKDVATNFKDKSEIDKFFNHKKLYKNPIFFDNCIEVLNRLNKKYEIAIATSGQNKNIRNKLKMFEKYLPDINVIPIMSPNFTLDNKNMIKCNIILVHGDKLSHNNLMDSILKLKYRWFEKTGIMADYCLLGHIHQDKIENIYARSGSLVGANGYSDNGLNIPNSRASQNIGIIDENIKMFAMPVNNPSLR